jgi:LmbE family N-acetylglucosaminyl deacetylase
MFEVLKKRTLLVLAPHPDDEILGCGGLIAKVKDLKGKVYVIIFSIGDVRQFGGESRSEERLLEMKNVMEFMKVDGYEVIYMDNNIHLKLDILPRKELIDIIESKAKYSIANVNPDIIAIPSLACQNQDHEAVFHASFTVCRPRVKDGLNNTPMVLAYEQPDILWTSRGFKPNFYVDISNYLNTKLKALSLYASQMREEPNLRSIENVKRMSRLRGSEICVEAAEAFECYRFVC